MSRKSANCYVIAGPNGAGKTTFATEFLPLYANCRNFINADLIARGLSPFDPDAGLLRAGRMVLERIAEFAEARTDFAFETTLAGRAYAPLLRRMKQSGFRLHLFYDDRWYDKSRAVIANFLRYLMAEDQVYCRIPLHESYEGQVVLMQKLEASAQYFERTFRR